MLRRPTGRPFLQVTLALLTAIAIAVPALAQSTGVVKGVITDAQNQPVANATVKIEATGGTERKFQTKTNNKGEFIQIGLASGQYRVSAEKDKLAAGPRTVNVKVGVQADASMVLGAATAESAKEAQAKAAELKKVFEAGVAASSAGNHDEAIAQFNAGIAINPNCNDCYNNIGFSYAAKKDYEKAEEAYKKAAEVKPDDAAAYNGLANIYNAQRKFDLASQASAKATELSGGAGGAAGGGGSADALYNQGVILWNGGKIPEAKKAFESAVQANPNHAEAHYQLGMALVNEGNLPGAATEFETYLKLSPDGPNAATAKSLVAQLKK
jgi:tetratricopeptide (TPR) repeat protein